MVYISNVASVEIIYEYKEAYIFIMLYRLVDGQFKKNPRIIEEKTTLYGYSLDDIIYLRNPKDLIKPSYEYGDQSEYYNKKNGLMLYISAFADNLKYYGSDILKGDFTIFSEADKILKGRVQKYS